MFAIQKKLQEFQLKANRFVRNYEIFKNTLLKERRVDFPEIPIALGNRKAETVITLISSPFCKYCEVSHEILVDILNRYPEDLKIQIILKSHFRQSTDQERFFKGLYEIYFKNEEMFIQALSDWYEKSDLLHWNQKYNPKTSIRFDEMINMQNEWCIKNEINYTPSIFINGYEYPKLYEKENLKYFINELVEDNF